jgi:hypothetical protein
MLNAHESPGFIGFAMRQVLEEGIGNAMESRHDTLMWPERFVIDF